MNFADSLLVSVFGIMVVFIVLVGLSVLVRIQSGIVSRFTRNRSGEAAEQSQPRAKKTRTRKALDSPQDEIATVSDTASLRKEIVSVPVPGYILDLNVAVGSAVKRGDVLLILEAMNTETEIESETEGTVTEILTFVGALVEAGAPLLVIEQKGGF